MGSITTMIDQQAEIARLQAEVERLKVETYDATKARDLAIEWRDYDKDRLDTAWNDAIEAAEDSAYRWAEKNARNKNTYVDLRDAIRALRRSEP